ncbi:MAG: nhaA [Alphaproteobacteria bacterium]|jgi:NhaA family Na+:H+ antiporter|nr:nhaA [Alphaproteobacteria bacterium]
MRIWQTLRHPAASIQQFLQLESAAGILLVASAAIALVCSNSALAPLYEMLLELPFTIALGSLGLSKPLLLWINDGLMALFFLVVGLEIKREVVEGELSSLWQIALPGVAALGGMAAPAAIYWFFNAGNPAALSGWAIPTATDIAFSLGVLALLGARVPLALKILLMAVAVFDDLGAIVVIAVFYTADLSGSALAVAGACLLALAALNLAGVRSAPAYVLVGLVLWLAVLKSGVHATLAGVALGLAIPIARDENGYSPLRAMEHGLHPVVAYAILPVFAFANAGVSFAGLTFANLLEPVTLGIAGGLVVGKQIGIMGSMALLIALGIAHRPQGCSWLALYGMAMLCGIGFTMSLFIGSLAFADPAYAAPVRLGVLGGSLLSAICGYALLKLVLPKTSAA